MLVFAGADLLDATNRHMRMAYTDARAFQYRGLPAGEYLAYASASADASDPGSGSSRALASVAVPFRLAADGHAHIALQLRLAPPYIR